MNDITKRFQEMFTRLKIATADRESKGKEPELSFAIKHEEQHGGETQQKSFAGDIDHLFEQQEKHLAPHDELTWKEKLRI
jgi:hypothetical protein